MSFAHISSLNSHHRNETNSLVLVIVNGCSHELNTFI